MISPFVAITYKIYKKFINLSKFKLKITNRQNYKTSIQDFKIHKFI